MAGVDLVQVLIAFTILIASLTFHEAAHAWTANALGDTTARDLGRLSLNPIVHIDMIGTIVFPLVAMFSGLPLIGWANPVPVDMRRLRHPRRDFAVVAIAGPISNLLLATAGALLLNVVYSRAEPLGVEGPALGLVRFVVINVLLAVFNMIPIPPLDGGNVLMGLVPESAARMIDRLRPWGFLLLYALMLSGMLYAIVSPIQNAILEWLL